MKSGWDAIIMSAFQMLSLPWIVVEASRFETGRLSVPSELGLFLSDRSILFSSLL